MFKLNIRTNVLADRSETYDVILTDHEEDGAYSRATMQFHAVTLLDASTLVETLERAIHHYSNDLCVVLGGMRNEASLPAGVTRCPRCGGVGYRPETCRHAECPLAKLPAVKAKAKRVRKARRDDDGGARSEAIWQARMGGDMDA